MMGLSMIAGSYALLLCSCHLHFYVGYVKMDRTSAAMGSFPMLRLPK
jgi:hypothetical protein